MDVRDAVASRFSCRAFLPTPVPLAVVREILDRAARAPSGGNLQPWRVDALAGAPLDRLKAMLRAREAELPRGEGTEYAIYPDNMKDPYLGRHREVGRLLYTALGIPREDRPARIGQYARNFQFFDAPVGLFISIDRSLGPPQWSDLGGFIQTILLLARAFGLHGCAQEAWTHWHKTVPPFLGLPADHILFCGIALGVGDEGAPVNRWRAPREGVDAFATFRGFAESDMPQS
jgi:nitroreductase